MKRPGYREAINWLAGNDDCYWLGEHPQAISVAAALVRDLFDVTNKKLITDLWRALKRIHPNHEALKGKGTQQ